MALRRLIELSPLDSARFGMRIARGRIEPSEVGHAAVRLQSEIDEIRPELTILRLPAGIGGPVRELLHSRPGSIHADTLVYYTLQLDSHRPAIAGKIKIAEATSQDLPAIAGIAQRAFSGYRSHYHASPRLDPALILQGYIEWALGYLSGTNENRATWVAKSENDEVIAFVTCRLDAEDASCEIVLNAVDPASAGQGVYGQLLSGVLGRVRDSGIHRVDISTQVWNYAVQKVWARQGFSLSLAYDTYHMS